MSLIIKKPYKVEYTETVPATDITEYVGTLQKMTNYGDGKINSAAFVLDARFGAFITKSNSGKTPILQNDYDRFRITLTDRNAKTYKRIFELNTDLSQKVNQGQTIPLELLGRDHNLELVPCTGNFEAPDVISFYDVIQHIADQYNQQRGTKQPFLATKQIDPPLAIDLNEAPKTMVGAFDFSDEPTCMEAFRRVRARMNLDVSRGGTGDKYTFVIEDHPTDDETVLLKIFVQGKLPASPVIVQSSSTMKVHSIAKRKEGKTGTRILVEGEDGTGAMPEKPHRFFSMIEVFNSHPDYVSSESYSQGVRIQRNGIHYEAKINVPPSITPPNATYWNVIAEKDVIGNFQASPWTQDKAGVIKNFFSNPTNPFNTDFNSPAIIDGNAVIRESNFWRDWALLRSNTDQLNSHATKKHYLWLQNNAGQYQALRILVDTNLGALGGSFAANGGKDKFGKNFANALCQWNGKEWIVIREPQEGDYVAVRAEGRNYGYLKSIINSRIRGKSPGFTSSSGPIQWRDVSQTFLGNDCFHYPTNIRNVKGLFRDIAAPSGFYNDDSGIEITYTFSLDPIQSQALVSLVAIIDGLIPGDQVDKLLILNIYNAGWWSPIFFSPFPENTLNAISENIGELYGGTYDTRNKFAIFDFNNVNYTKTGQQGMNNSESNELGELIGIAFNFKFEVKNGPNKAAFQGNIPFSLIIYDSESNVWKATKSYRIHGDIQEMEYRWEDFHIYKARSTWGTTRLLSNIVTPELDIRDVFEQKKVKFAILQMERSYDDVGRYAPFNWDNFIQSFLGGGSGSFIGTYDLVRFVKKPVASTPVTTERTIIPPKVQAHGIRNLIQLENIAYAEKDLREFQYEGYSVETDLSIDVGPEEGFYLKDTDMIQQSDNGSNTQKLVMKDLYYSADGNGAKRIFVGTERI